MRSGSLRTGLSGSVRCRGLSMATIRYIVGVEAGRSRLHSVRAADYQKRRYE